MNVNVNTAKQTTPGGREVAFAQIDAVSGLDCLLQLRKFVKLAMRSLLAEVSFVPESATARTTEVRMMESLSLRTTKNHPRVS